MSPGSQKTAAPKLVLVEEMKKPKEYVAALDIGTTTIRCHIYDRKAQLLGTAVDQVELVYPQVGYAEIDCEKLWNSTKNVITQSIQDANLKPQDIACLGISVQRSSFTTWNKNTGVPFHNIVTWRDLRAEKVVQDLNNCMMTKSMRFTSKFLYYLTRNERYLVGSQMKITNTQVTPRLLWALQNNYVLKDAVEKNCAMFGTLDTWLIYNLTGGKQHLTDASNAACTGFFDPFTMNWATWAFHVFNIPSKILPKIVDNSGDFGSTSPELFGHSIPIRSCLADQSASLFGSCAFKEGDLKVTLGTGSFINVHTGARPHGSISGIYPIVGWRVNDEIVYIVEGASNDTGTTIKWAQKIGIIGDPEESSDLAMSVKDTDGVYFIPSFSGLQAPVNDGLAAAGLIGIKPTTSKAHMIRAILESIAFRVHQIYQIIRSETEKNYEKIRIDGGVSKNDFLCQLISDLTELPVERPMTTEMSVLGAAYMAGLSAGVWKHKEELFSLRKIERMFYPRMKEKEKYEKQVHQWQSALDRFLRWYPE